MINKTWFIFHRDKQPHPRYLQECTEGKLAKLLQLCLKPGGSFANFTNSIVSNFFDHANKIFLERI